MKQSNGFRVISLFSGIGGLDLGFLWEGFNIIWANDLNSHAVDAYTRNFGLEPTPGDIHEIDLRSLPEAEVVIGGPPCQAFSLVGQRKTADPRGELVFKFLEAVETVRPLAFVMENVPGMAASRVNGVRLPDLLTTAFEKLGYHVTQTKLVATDYLVPQRRVRIVILGCRGSQPGKPDGTKFALQHYDIDSLKHDISATAAIGDLGPCGKKGQRVSYLDIMPSEFARLMRSAGLRDVSLHECPRMSEMDKLFVEHIPPGGNYLDIPDDIATKRVKNFKRTGGRTTTYGRLHPERPAYTINTYFRRPNVGCNFHYSEPRLITAREAMRFQSIPDHFEIDPRCPREVRNALIGNAVPPLMAQAIAWSLDVALASRVGLSVTQSTLT
ncbi:MAG: DNA cytosine methyltransferase [Candidatus Bathyarchaeia archaeon]|jgi:DNA (cytosine-5)-methyltransferase 1